MLFIELGNSTAKLARHLDDDTLVLERFSSVDALLKRVDGLDEAMIVAPVGARASERALERLRRREMVTVVTREMLAPFVGGSYDTPETLGIDRVLNLMGLAADGVVVSCGTAITVDALIGGRPVWGAIMPGFTTAAEGLHKRVPALPLVDIEREPRLPARTSVDSVANGVILGTARAAQSIARELTRSAGPAASLPVTITGGDAQILERLWQAPPEAVLDEHLLFTGLAALEVKR